MRQSVWLEPDDAPGPPMFEYVDATGATWLHTVASAARAGGLVRVDPEAEPEPAPAARPAGPRQVGSFVTGETP